MRLSRKRYSQRITTIVVSVFCSIAVGFIAFVCYEMHRLQDLSPVAYIGPSIVGLLATVLGAYMWRAKAQSKTDLEWEKTKQLTLWREKHPEAFTHGTLNTEDLTTDETGGVG